ncbi:sigma-54 interaction domain-containing protein [Alkalihalobacillus pseudalcaliphilus]|uniref:sigma-54 interaction domain-containing protein n=1 Tax=Alkalihalobacillus pseudalcaliphilus TaxID=79884 RepID=UPI003B5B940C
MNHAYMDEIFEIIFENAYHCIVIVDKEGVITNINETYCKFLGIDKSRALGRHVTKVIENSRMHHVVKSGQEEIADIQYIRGNHMIANRVPIFDENEVVGAVGTVLYKDTEEWMKMNSHIKDLLLALENQRKALKEQHGVTYTLHDIVGSSEAITHLKEKVKRVASGDVSVLLRGESGTGKELFAHSIHHLSERNEQPFIKVNCAAIPDHLLESELFGYKEGAFTGAKKGGKLGKFQLAHRGTIFLDEIGDMPLSAQVKILRVIQTGEVEALGSMTTDKVDVRIIAATNQPLEDLIDKQQFREDLFYRINVIQLDIPSLKERREDIRILAKYLLFQISMRVGKRIVDFNEQVMNQFLSYSWPGNVRELENVIAAAVHLTNSEWIQEHDLPAHFAKIDATKDKSLKSIIEETEKIVIKKALSKYNGDKKAVQQELCIGKTKLYEMIRKYKL